MILKRETSDNKRQFLDNLSGTGVKYKLTGTVDGKGEHGNIEG
jgi:hypothetical protein